MAEEKTDVKICVVCSEPASGVYFSALVCLPCKSFFIRSTKDGDPNFTCVAGDNACDVTLSNRLKCQHCRYQKCLAAGMCRKEKPEVVQPEEGEQLCGVCGDIANGVHFGVPTCEGCKKFFRRGMKEAETYECKDDKNCPINPRSRNNCRYCRYQRCIKVGMSRQAIRMGRPKKTSTETPSLPKNKRKSSPETPKKVTPLSSADNIVDKSSQNVLIPLTQAEINTVDTEAFAALSDNVFSSVSLPPLPADVKPTMIPTLESINIPSTTDYTNDNNMESLLSLFSDEPIKDIESISPATWSKQGTSLTADDKLPAKKLKGETDSNHSDAGYNNTMKLKEVNNFFEEKNYQRTENQFNIRQNYESSCRFLDMLAQPHDHLPSKSIRPEIKSEVRSMEYERYSMPSQPQPQEKKDTLSEHDKKILHEKLNAKMNLFSKYYWEKPIPLVQKSQEENRKHVLMLSKTVKAYSVLVKETDEEPRTHNSICQENNPNQKTHFAISSQKPFWDKIKNRIIQNMKSFVNFTKVCVPECVCLKEEDFRMILTYGAFHGMIILSSKERFDPEEQNFKYFWNWKVPSHSPAFLFRKNLLQVGAHLHNLQLDMAETSMMCLLSIISADWILLRDTDTLEDIRKPVVDAFCAYILVKYGHESSRLNELMAVMPKLRKLTLWHSELLQDMQLEISSDDVKDLFQRNNQMTVCQN